MLEEGGLVSMSDAGRPRWEGEVYRCCSTCWYEGKVDSVLYDHTLVWTCPDCGDVQEDDPVGPDSDEFRDER